MPSLDPTDVFPPRNLPGPAVPWGREVEERLNELKNRYKMSEQDLQGMNRALASQFSNLSRQIDRMSESVQISYSTQSITNAPGMTPGTQWTKTKPAWATYGLVSNMSVKYNSGSMTGEVDVDVRAGNQPIVDYYSAEFVLDFQINNEGIILYSQRSTTIDLTEVEDIYFRPLISQVSSGSGSVNVTLAATVTWFV